MSDLGAVVALTKRYPPLHARPLAAAGHRRAARHLDAPLRLRPPAIGGREPRCGDRLPPVHLRRRHRHDDPLRGDVSRHHDRLGPRVRHASLGAGRTHFAGGDRGRKNLRRGDGHAAAGGRRGGVRAVRRSALRRRGGAGPAPGDGGHVAGRHGHRGGAGEPDADLRGVRVVSNFVVLPLYFLSAGVFRPTGSPRGCARWSWQIP